VHVLERKAGTPLEISLSVNMHREPREIGSLDSSVDYAELVSLIQRLAETEYALLEELGLGILNAVEAQYDGLHSARILLAKPNIHLAKAKLASCSVELSREFRH